MNEIFQKTKHASRSLAAISDERKEQILLKIADFIGVFTPQILDANKRDLAKMEKENPLYDRLQLTEQRLKAIASDMRHVASLPSPLGIITNEHTLDNGLLLRRISVPFGVIGVIYEARPNVSFDVFSLCFKSGNACVLKGGKDADESNRAIIGMIRRVLEEEGVNPDVVTLLPATHEATHAMLNAVGYVDLCIPRGGKKLIEFVRDNARVPVIETGAGVVHIYLDEMADLQKAKAIITNAKTRRVSVCNALDCLLVNRSCLSALKDVLSDMVGKVVFHCDKGSLATVSGISGATVMEIGDDEYSREWMSYDLTIKTVDSIDEAMEHISQYGSGHSEAIITEDEQRARRFQQSVDAACVYWNAPTSFTDGAQFGLGAEIGISTQKLGPRGPMALKEMTTYKWLIDGNGQTRP